MPNEDTLYSAKHWAAKAKEYAEQASVNNSTITITQGGTTKGSFTLNQATDETIEIDAGGNQKTFDLFDHKWSDHLLNDQNWLRADTFSWHPATTQYGTYLEAYNHLVADLNSLTETKSFKRYDNEDDETDYIWVLMGDNSPYIDVGDYVYEITNDIATKTYQITAKTTTTITVNSKIYEAGIGRDSMVDADIISDPQTETVGSYTITYYQAQDGHKICLPDQETTVQNIYNESGVAWYYVLDTANQRFKLPRELPITDKSKGNGNPISFVNVKDTGVVIPSGEYYIQEDSGDARVNSGTTNNLKTMGLNSNSTKSSIISHRANENGQQYLYFYVGQFSQSAIEQTAGLNSELFNGKVDLNAANLSTAGKSLISGIGMPSSRYIDLTRGASGATYSMTSNGWLAVGVADMIANSGKLTIKIDGIEVFNEFCHQTQHNKTITVPVRKGSVVTITYTGNFFLLKFIYAEGEPNV